VPDSTSAGFVVAFVVGVTPGKWARVWGERLPQHPLDLRSMTPSEALAGLDDGSVDVALMRLPVEPPHLSAITLYEELPFVVAPKDHPLEEADSATLADLAAETLIDGEWSAAVELVAANVGVAIMPQSVARALSRRDVIARPVTDAPTTEIALVWVTSGTTELVEEFIGIVRGRTANSSRGTPTPPTEKPARKKPTTTGTARKPSKKTGKPRARKLKPR
jgi:DNA-binding transcriptional LysR family regulator